MGRTEHCKPAGLAASQKLGGNQARLNGFANTNVIGNQHSGLGLLECHQKRHKLIWAGLNGNATKRTERPGTAANTQSHSISQQGTGAVVAGVGGIWHRKRSRFNQLQIGDNACHFVVEASQWSQHQQFVLRLWQHNPLAAPGSYQCSNGKPTHEDSFPKMLGYSRIVASQSSLAEKRTTDQPLSSTQLVWSLSRACRVGKSCCGPSI